MQRTLRRGGAGKFELQALHWALLLSIGVHAGLLTVRFVDPERFDRIFRDTPLEVILVNAHSEEPPLQAQAIAQVNLAGGGDAERGRAQSPLPAHATAELGDSAEDARRRIAELQQQQQQLLTQIQQELALQTTLNVQPDVQRPDGHDPQERRRQMMNLLAEIERRINEENARPRKRYVSPATMGKDEAPYYERLKHRIEERGTRDFPEAQGRKLYGELTMNITVDATGRMVDAEIKHPSQSRLLDQRALAIVRAAGPFGALPPTMRMKADQFVFTSRFRFTHDDGVEAIVTEGP
jgi:protein TonB